MESSAKGRVCPHTVPRSGASSFFARNARVWVLVSLLFGPLAAAQESRGPGFDPKPLEIPRYTKSEARPITAIDLLALREPKGLSISLDGKYVAFVAGQAVLETNSYRSALYVVSTAEGAIAKNLGSAGPPHWDEINQWLPENPEWSPDSRSFTYRMKSQIDDSWQVWQWRVGDDVLTQATDVPGNVLRQEWMQNGHELFLEVEPLESKELPSISGESGILYDGEFRPWESVSIRESIRRFRVVDSEYWIFSFETRRGRKATKEEIEKLRPRAKVADTSALPQNISIAVNSLGEAKRSPVDARVAYLYTTTDPAVSKLVTQGILIEQPETGRQILVKKDTSYIDRWWWSSDGRTIYYIELRGSGRSTALMAASTSNGSVTPVFGGSEGEYFSEFSVSSDGEAIACLREDNTRPPDIVLLQRRTGEIRSLVEMNPEFHNLRLSIPSRIEGVNSYGESWFAYLVKPIDYSPARKYPLIVTTYRSGDYFLGGASGNENPIQVYAASGFVVLCVDVGRSRNIKKGDFADKVLDWASPTASIVTAVEGLIATGVVDSGRIGIAGFSHGEEIAAYAITHTNLFHAVIGGSGYDPYFYDLAGNRWRRRFHDWGLRGWAVNEDRQKWKEIAVSLRGDQVLCPMLENVPEAEYVTKLSTEAALADLGKPFEMHVYPDELHVKNQPRNRFEIWQRNLDWFRFWLVSDENLGREKQEEVRRWKHLKLLLNSDHAAGGRGSDCSAREKSRDDLHHPGCFGYSSAM